MMHPDLRSQYVHSEKILHDLRKDEKESHFSQEVLETRVYESATILPHRFGILTGGVCDYSGEFILNTGLHEGYDGSYQYNPGEVESKSLKKALFLGTWSSVYGHCITDNIKKFWFLFTEEGQNILNSPEEYDIIYVNLAGDQRADYMQDIVLSLGLNLARFCAITSIVRYQYVIIPDNSLILRDGVRYYTVEYKNLIDKIKNSCPNHPSFKKVYLTRSKIHDGKDFNEKSIEVEFVKKGYKVISPEQLTFQEQVSLMKGCEQLVSTVGSISHQVLFCSSGVSVVLLNKADYVNGYQLAINKLAQVDVMYIDSHNSLHSKPLWKGPFFLWKTRQFCQYMGIKYYSPYWSPIYYRYLGIFIWRNNIRPRISRVVKSFFL